MKKYTYGIYVLSNVGVCLIISLTARFMHTAWKHGKIVSKCMKQSNVLSYLNR